MDASKFTFDDDFENSFSQNRLQETAFAEGREAGRAEALDSLEQNCENLTRNILTAAQNLGERQDEQVALMHKEAAKLAFTIMEKLAPAAVEKTPLAEIELLVNQCLENSPLEPRLVIRVDEAILPGLQDKLEKMQQSCGYPGQVILISETMTHISDCRVEWANGGVERDFNSLMNTIKNTVQNFIDAPETENTSATSQIDPDAGTISETITT
ncbi:MAG: hypothetical protein COB49_04795 [Alphaproteobacteria bacterium]|nr:MAG: hypothetical protein COB49_04795 [Alphaproteobacteria bacterium]